MDSHECAQLPPIMVVEDDQPTRELLASVIARRFPCTEMYLAENGAVGVEIFRQHSPPIVVTDIKMPVMDGIQMAGTIRQLQPKTHFVVLTAYNNREYLGRFDEIGYCAYISKPIQCGRLFDALEKCGADAASGIAPELGLRERGQ